MTRKQKLKILNKHLNDLKNAPLDKLVFVTYTNPDDPKSKGRIRTVAPVKAEDKDEIALLKDKNNKDLYLFVQTNGYSKKGILRGKNVTSKARAKKNIRTFDLDSLEVFEVMPSRKGNKAG